MLYVIKKKIRYNAYFDSIVIKFNDKIPAKLQHKPSANGSTELLHLTPDSAAPLKRAIGHPRRFIGIMQSIKQKCRKLGRKWGFTYLK